MGMLKSRLFHLAQQQQLDRIEDIKGEVSDIAWGSQIRSYVFCPYTMVKDHRTEFETGDVEGVLSWCEISLKELESHTLSRKSASACSR